MTKRRIAKTLFPFLIYLLMARVSPALADEAAAAAPAVDPANDPGTGLNIMWMLISGLLVLFMQAGFALVETGFTRAKNVVHTSMMNMMVF